MRLLRSMFLVMIITGSLFLTSCIDDNDNPSPVEVAYVSIYHGSPDTESLNISVNGTGQINALPFEYEDYTNYLNFYPGNRTLIFSNVNNAGINLVDTTFTFDVNETYSIFIADSLSSIEAIMVKDSFPDPISGKAMVRFVHLSPDAPMVNVLVNEDELFLESSFRDASDFMPVEADRNTFEFISTDDQNTLLTVPNVELLSKEYYTIVLNGFNNPPAGNTHELSTDIIRL